MCKASKVFCDNYTVDIYLGKQIVVIINRYSYDNGLILLTSYSCWQNQMPRHRKIFFFEPVLIKWFPQSFCSNNNTSNNKTKLNGEMTWHQKIISLTHVTHIRNLKFFCQDKILCDIIVNVQISNEHKSTRSFPSISCKCS